MTRRLTFSFAPLALVALLSFTACGHRAVTVTERLPDVGAGSAMAHFDREPSSAASATDSPVLGPASSIFDWPVDSARMTRGFLPKKRRPHLGLDLAAPKGTPILAARGGVVIYRGHDFRGYGRMVMVESPDGWATLYAHLDKFLVEEGQKVAMGDMLATMGRTGHATGVHLHFEIRHGRMPVDPLAYLPGGAHLHKQALVSREPSNGG